MSRPHPAAPVLRLDDLPLTAHAHGTSFAAATAAIAAPLGAKRLGARLIEVPPGKAAWPFHSHHANDEMFVVLSGTGELRLGDQRHAVGPGMVAVCPAGGPETAHQFVATGTEPLRYLAISSMHEPDVMEYPDSGKVNVVAGSAPGGAEGQRRFKAMFRAADAVGYWDGET